MAWLPKTENLRLRRLNLADLGIMLFVISLIVALLLAGRVAPEDVLAQSGPFNLTGWSLPVDALRSLSRIFIAFVVSLVFTIGYGYAAAYTKVGDRILVPLLDILQSVPVLGFLAASVGGFVLLFGPFWGFEAAAIFAIFTAQAWNMTFAFYHTLRTLPKDLQEASSVMRLSRWQRLIHFELPAAIIPLVLNSMMSFGGSWFFLAASESFLYQNRTIHLPGIGSYIAVAQQRGDTPAVLAAMAALLLMIVAVDQLFWRPLVAWSTKFKMGQVESQDEAPSSFILTTMRRSTLVQSLRERLLVPVVESLEVRMIRRAVARPPARREWRMVTTVLGFLLIGGTIVVAVLGAARVVSSDLGLVPRAVVLGFLTLGRVLAAVGLGALWTVPVGVWVGMNERALKWAQPFAQMAASFPANVLFPLIVVLFIRIGLNLNWGAIPLMMLGTQWYILFNVMAGAMAIPADLKEAGKVFGLRGARVWRELILPAIFPSLITGGITAAGGAWNASIVAEVVVWHHKTLAASGLGALVTQSTASGNTVALLVAIVVMSTFVVATNRLLWRPLYRLAETRFHVEE